MKPQGQKLDGDNLQEVLDAGKNAAKKGRQQFFTPPDIASVLMVPLPGVTPPVFVDLTMGDGSLLSASGASVLLGIDIDSRLARKPTNARGEWSCVNADLTKFYPFLHEIDWQFDLCGLNPPFSIQWHRHTMKELAESECKAVRATFGKRPANMSAVSEADRGKKGQNFVNKGGPIDSALATMLIALDRMTTRGEGYLICPHTVAEKMRALPVFDHVWAWLSLPQTTIFANTRPLDLAVLYFARSHTTGNAERVIADTTPSLHHSITPSQAIREALLPIRAQRVILRKGLSLFNEYDFAQQTFARWEAAKDEWLRLHSERRTNKDYNIWLGKSGSDHGKIRRHLTPFQQHSGRIKADVAQALNRLDGQTPMALVVQRVTRSELLAAIAPTSPWRVDPELIAAVQAAVAAYHSQRAPFYPLNDVQRLGYLDEEDVIACKRSGLHGFEKGESYALSSETVHVERPDTVTNLLGEDELVTYHGQELAFYIVDSNKKKHKFSPVKVEHESKNTKKASSPADFVHTTEDLVRHFTIPEVQDVAQADPARYQAFVKRIQEIEREIAARLAA